MKFFKFLISPILSLYSLSFYKRQSNASLKYGFFYLLYIAAIGAIVLMITIQSRAMPVLDEFAGWFTKEMPEITLDSGNVSSKAPQPFVMKHPKYGTILILDSTKESLKPDEIGEAAITITKTLIYVHNRIQKDTQTIDLTQFYEKAKKKGKPLQAETINGEVLRKMYAQVKPVLSIAFFLIVFIYLFFWKLGAAFAYSAIAVIFNLLQEKKFPYPAILNVTIYSMTAVCVLQLLGLVTKNLRFDVELWIAIGITTAYLGLVFFVAVPPEEKAAD